jgi:hypothetical protein
MLKVFVGIPCGDLARYPKFWMSLTCQHLGPGGIIRFAMAQSCYIDDNQNELGRLFMASDCDYVFLANDDQVYQQDTIARLVQCIQETGAGAAVSLCLSRQPPFYPLLYDVEESPGHFRPRLLRREDVNNRRIEVLSSGGGGTLVKREVMEKIGDPWWENTTFTNAVGKRTHLGEDHDFCKKVRAAGYKIMADMTAMVGHMAMFEIKPKVSETGDWMTVLERHGTEIGIPAPSME